MDFKLNEMKIEVTKKCPLACVHCSSNSNEQTIEEISLTKCKNIIEEAFSMGLKELSFSGGEPLIWAGLFESVNFAHNKGLSVNVYTSGNVENRKLVFRNLKIMGLKKAIFSLYSDCEDEHNRVTRKKESYNNTLDAINEAIINGIITEVHFVALKNSFHRLEGIVKLTSRLGVSRVSVLRFVPQGRGALLNALTKAENHELIVKIKDLKRQGFDIRTGSPFNVLLLNDNPKCMAARDRLIISPSLKIYPCDAFKNIESIEIADTDIFSSLNENSLMDCWEKSPYFNTVRSAILREPTGACKSCSLYVKCLSGCLAQKFIVNHSLAPAKDPACTMS